MEISCAKSCGLTAHAWCVGTHSHATWHLSPGAALGGGPLNVCRQGPRTRTASLPSSAFREASVTRLQCALSGSVARGG